MAESEIQTSTTTNSMRTLTHPRTERSQSATSTFEAFEVIDEPFLIVGAALDILFQNQAFSKLCFRLGKEKGEIYYFSYLIFK